MQWVNKQNTRKLCCFISYYFVSFQQDKFELLKAEGIATPI